MTDARGALEALHSAARDAVHGGRAVERWLRAHPEPGARRVLAVGKAACAMAEGARAALGDRIRAGLVTTAEGHARPVPGFEVLEAAHPVPDLRSVVAAERALALASEGDEPLLVLISGGASALWSAPRDGLSFGDLQTVTRVLLRAGVDIATLNAVRCALSRIKGGGLLRAAGPRPVLTLAISDVRGDPPETIGSGPTVRPRPLAAGRGDALLERLREAALDADLLSAVGSGLVRESDDPPGDARYVVVAGLHDAIAAAQSAASASGLRAAPDTFELYGEARALAAPLLAAAAHAGRSGCDLLIAGGEPTVTVRGPGRGGRAQELALAIALAIEGSTDRTALVAGTDGRDGPTDAAGGFADGGTAARARAAGVDPVDGLDRNDAHRVLDAADDLFRTGPTDTNVTDLAFLRIAAAPR